MRINIEHLLEYCISVFHQVGLSLEDAAVAAESLVDADKRGVTSHGVTRLSTYAKRISTKVISSECRVTVENEKASTMAVNGNNGMGSVIGKKTMDLCMEKAGTAGSCFASVYNGNHFGIGSFFTLPAAEKGYIAIAMSNAPASVVPFGGSERKIGTNPLSIALPSADGVPYVLDMATSVVAQGKIIQAKKDGKEIPPGWAIDKNGLPATDPAAALEGAMLPFGGPKGYAIGLLIQILCSAVAGGNRDTGIPSFWQNFEDPQNLGHFFGVLKVDSFLPIQTYSNRMAGIKSDISSTKPAPGFDEVMFPGEIEYRKSLKAAEAGLDLSDSIVKDILSCGKEYGVDTNILTR